MSRSEKENGVIEDGVCPKEVNVLSTNSLCDSKCLDLVFLKKTKGGSGLSWVFLRIPSQPR